MKVQASSWAKMEDVARGLVATPGIQHIAITFTATSVAGLFNFLFHAFISRLLGPAEYGIFAALLGLFMILSAPTSILQTVVTKYVAHLSARRQLPGARALMLDVLKRSSLLGLVGLSLLTIFSSPIAAFLKLSSTTPVIVMGGMLLTALITPVILGSALGLQWFTAFGAILAGSSASRLAFGVGLVLLGMGASGALAGSILAGGIVVALASYLFRTLPQGEKDREALPLSDIYAYSTRVLVVSLCYMALTNMDLLVVKSFFSPTEAGHYGVASTLGKIVLFFPSAIVLVMFPKAAHRYAIKRRIGDLVFKSLAVTATLCMPIVLLYLFYPVLPVLVFAGDQYLTSAPLLGALGLAMTLFGLASVWMYYYLSVGSLSFVFVIVSSTILELVSLLVFHSTLFQVVAVLTLNAGILVAAATILFLKEEVSTSSEDSRE